MNQQTNFERMAMEHAAREAELDRLQLEREINGPTQLEISRARIAELEIQRDQVYADAAEWIKDLQEYLPGATGLHDVYRGIEALESKAANCKAAMQKLMSLWPEDFACGTDVSAAFDACYEAIEQEKKS